MATSISVYYWIGFGKNDCSDSMDYEVEVNGKEESFYKECVRMRRDLECSIEADKILGDKILEIKEEALNDLIDAIDPYTMECLGLEHIAEDEINEYVQNNKKAANFFGVADMVKEELDKWDIMEHKDLLQKFRDAAPMVKDFDDNFFEISPFDRGYSFGVRLSNDPVEKDVYEEEAQETIDWILTQPNKDELLKEYVENIEDLANGFDIEELIKQLTN